MTNGDYWRSVPLPYGQHVAIFILPKNENFDKIFFTTFLLILSLSLCPKLNIHRKWNICIKNDTLSANQLPSGRGLFSIVQLILISTIYPDMGFESFFLITALVIWRVYSLKYAGALMHVRVLKRKNEIGLCKECNRISEQAL